MTGTTHEPCSVTVFRTIARDALMARVRGEYREMPGMRLTIDQAMKLWMLDRKTCSGVLNSLVAAHFLEMDRHGQYVRAHSPY